MYILMVPAAVVISVQKVLKIRLIHDPKENEIILNDEYIKFRTHGKWLYAYLTERTDTYLREQENSK